MNEENKQYEENLDDSILPQLDEYDEIEINDEYAPPPSARWVNISIITLIALFGLFALCMLLLFRLGIILLTLEQIVNVLLTTAIVEYGVCLIILAVWKLLESKWKKIKPFRMEINLVIDGKQADTEYICFESVVPLNRGFFLHIKPTATGFIEGVAITKTDTEKMLYKMFNKEFTKEMEHDDEDNKATDVGTESSD